MKFYFIKVLQKQRLKAYRGTLLSPSAAPQPHSPEQPLKNLLALYFGIDLHKLDAYPAFPDEQVLNIAY